MQHLDFSAVPAVLVLLSPDSDPPQKRGNQNLPQLVTPLWQSVGETSSPDRGRKTTRALFIAICS